MHRLLNVECESLVEMIRENLIAERIAIESYSEMVRYIGDRLINVRGTYNVCAVIDSNGVRFYRP